MFQILNLTTGEICEVDKPRYVKRNERGIWIQCDDIDAECIAINGDRFSISGREIIEDAPEIVAVNQIDGAQKLAQVNLDAIKNSQNIEEVKTAIADITDAILDIYLNGLN